MRSNSLSALLLLVCVALGACSPGKSSMPTKAAAASMAVKALPAASPRVYIISPVDGETVASTFKVVFGLDGMGVAPAGIELNNTGHHHLLINMDTLPDLTQPLPASEQLVHFGGGQTEASVTLPAGSHTLQLLLGDFSHVPVENMLSEKITITVVE